MGHFFSKVSLFIDKKEAAAHLILDQDFATAPSLLLLLGPVRGVQYIARCFLLYNSYLSFPFVRPILVEFCCRCKWEKLLFKQLNINIFKQTWR